jgi:hypothetical protein
VELHLKLLPERVAVCQLPTDSAVPAWAMTGPFCSATRTPNELSIVCQERAVPAGVRSERGWRAMMLVGPLEFSLTGVLEAIAQPLAAAGVPIFAISTFDTDYVLVKEPTLEAAKAALTGAGHRFF